jgi:hypothetical protein
MEAAQKTKNRTAIQLAIPLLGIYLKKYKSGYNKDTCTPTFIAALFTIAKLWKQSICSSRKCDIYSQWNFIQP